MATVTIVSGFSPAGYREYGMAFLETFAKRWPTDVKIVVYTEEAVGKRMPERIEERSLWLCDGVKEFIDRHPEPVYHGKARTPGWNKKDDRAEYSFRYDVVRFCRQLFIPEHAAGQLPDGAIMVWFDADCIAFEDVPSGAVERLIGDHDLITMGRDGSSTELGFWAMRLGKQTRHLLRDIVDSYRTGSFQCLHEWHSGWIFDHWVDHYRMNGLIKHKSLTGGHGHIWFTCEIGKWIDHLKGPRRKQIGFSPERYGITVAQFDRRSA